MRDKSANGVVLRIILLFKSYAETQFAQNHI